MTVAPGGSGDMPFGGDFDKASRVLMAHAVMASLAFVVFFPFGAISIRVFNFKGLLWLHVGLEILAYSLYICGFGLGVYFATEADYLGEYHAKIGIVLFVLVFFQPATGYLHHRLAKINHCRNMWSQGHIWLGRAIITLGMINGGLGLLLVNNTGGGTIAYGVFAGIVWVIYVASIVYGERKRRVKAVHVPADGTVREMAQSSV